MGTWVNFWKETVAKEDALRNEWNGFYGEFYGVKPEKMSKGTSRDKSKRNNRKSSSSVASYSSKQCQQSLDGSTGRSSGLSGRSGAASRMGSRSNSGVSSVRGVSGVSDVSGVSGVPSSRAASRFSYNKSAIASQTFPLINEEAHLINEEARKQDKLSRTFAGNSKELTVAPQHQEWQTTGHRNRAPRRLPPTYNIASKLPAAGSAGHSPKNGHFVNGVLHGAPSYRQTVKAYQKDVENDLLNKKIWYRGMPGV